MQSNLFCMKSSNIELGFRVLSHICIKTLLDGNYLPFFVDRNNICSLPLVRKTTLLNSLLINDPKRIYFRFTTYFYDAHADHVMPKSVIWIEFLFNFVNVIFNKHLSVSGSRADRISLPLFFIEHYLQKKTFFLWN